MTDPTPIPPGTFNLAPADVAARLARGEALTLLDVRESDERETAHIAGSLWIPVAELQQRVGELDPQATTVVYCHLGPRSAWAVEFLRARGFRAVYNMAQGIVGWSVTVDRSLRP